MDVASFKRDWSCFWYQEVSGEELNNLGTEDQAFSTVKVICRICFSGENEGSNRALKMLPCRLCSKKYHRSCLKVWAEYRGYSNSWFISKNICESFYLKVLYLQIYFIGVHGRAPLAVFVRLVFCYLPVSMSFLQIKKRYLLVL